MTAHELFNPFLQIGDSWRTGAKLWGPYVASLDLLADCSDLLLWVWFTVAFIKRSPPNQILRRYSFKAWVCLMVPFKTRWLEGAPPEHVELFQKFRRTFVTFGLALLILGIAKFAYYKCFFMRLHALGWPQLTRPCDGKLGLPR